MSWKQTAHIIQGSAGHITQHTSLWEKHFVCRFAPRCLCMVGRCIYSECLLNSVTDRSYLYRIISFCLFVFFYLFCFSIFTHFTVNTYTTHLHSTYNCLIWFMYFMMSCPFLPFTIFITFYFFIDLMSLYVYCNFRIVLFSIMWSTLLSSCFKKSFTNKAISSSSS